MYTAPDYLCNEPYYIEGIGHLRCPTLRECRRITFGKFYLYLNHISLTLNQYLEMYHLQESYDKFTEEVKATCTLYTVWLSIDAKMMYDLLNFFILDQVYYNEEEHCFEIYRSTDDPDNNIVVGHIGNENFEMFLDELKCILGVSTPEEAKPKFANKLAQEIFDKFKNAPKPKSEGNSDMYNLDNMILKYCTHNTVGINMLNVWELTYHQFMKLFNEFTYGRQCNLNLLMAANSFQYKKSADYKPLDYMKQQNN